MKRITGAMVAKLPFDTYRRDPKPFPGLHPTRWVVWLKWDPVLPIKRLKYRAKPVKKPEFPRGLNYLGKPTQKLAQFCAKVLATYHSQLEFLEFDKGGTIIWSETVKGPAKLPASKMQAKTIVQFYYPFCIRNLTFTNWASSLARMDRIPMVFKGKKFVVYSQNRTPSPESVEDHREWLEKNIVWGK